MFSGRKDITTSEWLTVGHEPYSQTLLLWDM